MLNIVLHEPEMPANTGNIGRTCVATGSVLHLIEPMGFRLNEKMIKIAGGIMNTHSRQADARMEILTAYAALAGAGTQVLQRIMQSATTDAGLDILKEAGFLEPVMALVLEKIHMHLQRRAGDHVEIGVILFSNVYGLLGQTDNVAGLLAKRRP